MNAEILLKHFDRISEVTDAVPRLRQFILDLAVLGKLVEQDANDEPASHLLKRIRSERVRLANAGESRKEKALPPLSHFELHELPPLWCWSQLAEVGCLNPRNSAPDDLQASFVPMPMISAEYGIANRHEVRRWGDIKSGYTHFAEGDVGLAKITPCFENGKSAIFRGLTGGIGAGTTELHIVRPILVSAEYILIFLKSPHFIESGIPKMTGTAGQKRVPTEYFSYSPFPLPPLTEQHRIVAKVEELMTLCDRLEEAQNERENRRDQLSAAALHYLNNGAEDEGFREHARFFINHLPRLTVRPKQIKGLRQSILDLAVRGKLVPQCADDEAASKLLDRLRSRRDSVEVTGPVRRRKSELSPMDYSLAPFDIPSNWTWARFPELGVFGRGKSKHRPRNDPSLFDGGTHPLIQTGDVARSKGLVETYTGMYNDVGLAQSHKWPAGTLCITIAANIADSGILTFAACFPDSVVGFVPAAVFSNARYFEYFLRTAKENLLEFAPATAQKNINLEILNAVMIPLPPVAEQIRIVERVDHLMHVCDQLEEQLSTARMESHNLLEAVLHYSLAPVAVEAQ
jgi:type I restriction enzyme S subunit